MFNIEKTHFILDEMILNGCIVDANKINCIEPIKELDKTS